MAETIRYEPASDKTGEGEYLLFSHIAMNWRGKPLVSLVAIVNLIASTRTAAGLRVRSEIDRGSYPQGVVVTDEQMAQVHSQPHRFHGEWNYTLRPTRARK